MQPFDLQKALAGAALVTRDGREVLDFGPCGQRYSATVGGDLRLYDAYGHANATGPNGLDLFLVSNVSTAEPLQIGDWIPCIKSCREPFTENNYTIRKGKYYRVSSVGPNGEYYVVTDIGVHIYDKNDDVFDVSRRTTNPPAIEINDTDTVTPKIPKSILQEAQELIYGNRQRDYGSVTTNFTNIAKGWSVILGVDVTPEQVGLAMAWVKIARQSNKKKRDNLVDIAGYIGCIDKLERGE